MIKLTQWESLPFKQSRNTALQNEESCLSVDLAKIQVAPLSLFCHEMVGSRG